MACWMAPNETYNIIIFAWATKHAITICRVWLCTKGQAKIAATRKLGISTSTYFRIYVL